MAKSSRKPIGDVAKKPKQQTEERFEKRTELAAQEHKNFLALVETDEEIAANVARVLAQPAHKFSNEVTDDEIEARTADFFEWCVQTGTSPSMERFALAIGTTRETIRRWRSGIGCSDERKYLMQQAVEMMAAYDAEMVNKGKMPVVSYIFRGKNYYDMEDTKRVMVDADTDRVQSPESLIAEARRLSGDFIDADYEEVK